MEHQNRYQKQWDDLKKRIYWISYAYPLILVGASQFGGAAFRTPATFASIITALLAGLAFLIGCILAWRLEDFTCPRCGRKFFRDYFYHNSFSNHCLHCHLKKWSGDDNTEQENI
jgi:hypothetical protein